MEAPTYKKGQKDGLRPEENSPQAVPENSSKKERLPVVAPRSGLGLSPYEIMYRRPTLLMQEENKQVSKALVNR